MSIWSTLSRVISPDVDIYPIPLDQVEFRYDVDIPMRDGESIKCNVYLPKDYKSIDKKLPVIMCAHPYSKDILPKKGIIMNTVPLQYRLIRMARHVRFSEGTGWEAPDPVVWVLKGYVVINVDLRGFFKSSSKKAKPNLMCIQEAQDYYDAIEWAARQEFSSGKVALMGVSYLAISQYMVAALNPPHLCAIVPWEGFTDVFKDAARPGGIKDEGFLKMWFSAVSKTTEENMLKLYSDIEIREDPFYLKKVPDLKNIIVPALICMSYSDHGLHSNGSFRCFREISSKYKWLHTHRDGKWANFYDEKSIALQTKFLDFFLKDELDNGMDKVPRVSIEIRKTGSEIHKVVSYEDPIYPTLDTKWTKLFFGKNSFHLSTPPSESGSVSLDALSGHVVFSYNVPEDLTTSGPMKVNLTCSSRNLTDMNIFAFVKKFNADGVEVNFEGMLGYQLDVVTKGWQRLALRKPFPTYKDKWDADKPFDELQSFPTDGSKQNVTISLLPSSTFFEKGSRIELQLQGRWLFPVSPMHTICNYEASKLPGSLEIHFGDKNSFLLIGLI